MLNLDAETMFESILDYHYDNLKSTMSELCNEISGFHGNLEWYFNFNSIVFSECSPDAITVMRSMIADRLLYPKIVTPSDYPENTFTSIYPFAKSLTRRYKFPHLIPLEFSVNPPMVGDRKAFQFDTLKSGLREPMYQMWPELVKKHGNH